ncbi:IS110 family RNA-guided transposase [Chlorobium phaeobacteroides]|uniref:Transposase n=1 Tax=Chlorobium phaeobacteroides (strain DSM 266 / SMG 266 / 2430) TaxID=290317 RepID=A1BCF2_CHLPD|nr:IS110 family transposase [Chlorobium phaeobacteroides]ABL64095.1 transposase [Chlorobium phaeobacteroides DSM 266]
MRKSKKAATMSLVHPNAAGIDIGSQFHDVAIPPDRAEETVKSFKSFTGDLHAMAKWLTACRIDTIAMESTGVYWIPAFEILENYGFKVFLVNAREAKNVPGRKTDSNDAQWLQKLHQLGLLRASFQPTSVIAELRAYLRQREKLLDYKAAHIQHMQKALMQMNIQLHHVVSTITGKTGMDIIRAIVAGNRNPQELVKFRDVRCKNSIETMTAALTGNFKPEHIFALMQSLELYDIYNEKAEACDREIQAVLDRLQQNSIPPDQPLPKAKYRECNKNAPAFDVRQTLFNIIGVDLTQITGLGSYLALKLVSECGADMSKWPTDKHFTSWLCLSPGNKISGGKILSSRTRPSSSRAAALLRLAATAIGRTETALGAFYRRLATRTGKAKAVTATARKIAVLFYNTLRYGMRYVDPGADYYEEQYKARILGQLRRRADSYGFSLQPMEIPDTAIGVS